jgi:hypothetical protein
MLQTSDALDLVQQSTSSSEYSPDVPSLTKPQRVHSHVKISLFGKDTESPQLSGISLLYLGQPTDIVIKNGMWPSCVERYTPKPVSQ